MKYIGLLIIVSSIFILLLNFEYNKEIQNQNEDRVDNYLKVTSNIETSDKSSTPESVTTPITSTFNYSGILEIPKINLKAGFANSDDNFTIINYAIGADPNSVYPSEQGNFILYAHSGNSSIAYFKNLNKVSLNDDIYVYVDGVKYHYQIVEMYNVEKIGTVNVLASETEKYITLITCSRTNKNQQLIVIGKYVNKELY